MMTKADGKRGVTILGSTGSIGRNTVQLIQANQDCYHVHALVAGRNVSLLVQQALDLRPDMVVVADSQCYAAVKQALNGSGIAVAAGPDAVVEAACLPANWVMAAIVGAAGLPPTLAAIRRGAVIGLANKECLVCAGSLLMDEVKRHGATFIPVDSEHSAIFQVFETAQRQRIEKIILTASGGPFRTHTLAQMAGVTPAQAVAHPNWSMGAKISVDSASMMNKGLELIEAHHLFNMPEEQIDILVHPQSVIHSMVSYADGSVLAQLGSPDMRTPIAYALGWPDRMSSPAPKLDLAAIGQLTFESPDESRFPALRLARQVLHMGPAAPTVLNAANEIAVQAFLEGRVGFLDIARIVEQVLAGMETDTLVDIEGVFQQDRWAREKALALISAAAF